ncbi:hypothetical protein ACHAWF_000867, partial [Thalassiosira exigua]
MSKPPPEESAAPAAASASAASSASASASTAPAHPLGELDIRKVMSSVGPIVSCVLLRCKPPDGEADVDPSREPSSMSIKEIKRELGSYGIDGATFVEKAELVRALEDARRRVAEEAKEADSEEDGKPPANGSNDNDGGKRCNGASAAAEAKPSSRLVPLRHLIDEVRVDTTPRKSAVAKLLGGDFTFLGQYEEEGIVVMARRPDWEDDDDDGAPPPNPHRLQPPLDDAGVRGDVLLMRVAETEEELDRDDGAKAEAKTKAGSPEVHVPTNDEFFLDYTKEEYLAFAARTDIVAKETEESSSEEEESEEEEEEEEDEKPGAKASAKVSAPDAPEDDDEDEDFDPLARAPNG